MTTHFNNKIDRINCPFDFTLTGRVGLNYAGMLAAAIGARLTIFYVEPTVWPEELQRYQDQNDSNKGIKRLLKLEAFDMSERFGIEAEYAIEPTTGSIGVAVGSMSTDYDLIVMGTNGADDLYHQVFGVNTHHTLGLTRCPVLVVPLGYDIHIPRDIVYAFNSESNPHFLNSHLDRLTSPLDAAVHTLNVQKQDTSEAERKIELLGEVLGVTEKEEFDWGFEPTYSDEVVASVNEYMKDRAGDILALSYHHRTLFEKLFLENVIKKVNRMADYPVLLFWH